MWSFGTTMTMPKDGESASIPPPQAPPVPMSQPQQLSPPSIVSQRALKQFGLFMGGACFMSLSVLITRRSIARKARITMPKFYTQSNRPVNKLNSDGSRIALEALNLATLNVLGFAIMMTGGVSWAFDISNIEDLRRMTRKHIGPGGRTDEEAEREVQEWIAKVLLRKEERQQKGADANSTTKGNGD
ncbi:hypothetical protein F4861DRAFT_96634 [Xylaria intraflava]|nr:hypothetical protein F4861DRAFT_96634 [Xylaria intraflava]